MYCYIWEYSVEAQFQAKFETLYGPNGAWVELFKTDPSYIRTELFRDLSNPFRYVTIDYWISKGACITFRKKNRSTFDAIDADGDRLTLDETKLGDFDLLSVE